MYSVAAPLLVVPTKNTKTYDKKEKPPFNSHLEYVHKNGSKFWGAGEAAH